MPKMKVTGLTMQEARERLARFGPNELTQARGRSLAAILRNALREPMFLFLMAAALLYLVVGDKGEGLFLLFGACVSIGLVAFQDARSERALVALRQLATPFCHVIRDGVQQRLPATDLVPGDALLVAEGERAPADGVLAPGSMVTVDESLLTGESVPVIKQGGEEIHSGTMIVRGHGLAEVTMTGAQTQLGRIGKSLSGVEYEQTPLQRATARIVAPLAGVALAFCIAVALAYGLMRGDWFAGGLAGLTVAISLLPEEFPMVPAVFLALGSWRLARHRVLVRRAAVIETLGAVTMLCVDKTGTLTENRMRVGAVWARGALHSETLSAPEARSVLEAGVLASASHPIDPMDTAIHAAAAAFVSDTMDAYGGEPFNTWPLRPEMLAVIQYWRTPDGAVFAAAKGAPEAVFRLCQLDEAESEKLEDATAEMAGRGMRVLAVAAAPDAAPDPAHAAFVFSGLIGFVDPLRDSVRDALFQARQAGVDVAMITGDYPATALEIARQAGLDVAAGVLTGSQIAALDAEQLRERVRTTRIFARVMPEQKLALVEAFRANGGIVAMTGDGVNDAPALEKAHVGIAMGGRGSDIAREAADIVLLDDSFASIVGGIRLGRRIFANLRKALTYVAAIHIPIAGVALLPILFGAPPLLYPMHVVVLELIIDPMCSLVFEAQPSDRQAMRRPPRPVSEPLFGRRQLSLAVAQGVILLAGVLLAYFWALNAGQSTEQARAVGFVTMVLGNLVLALALSVEDGASLIDPRRLIFWGIAAGALAIVVSALSVPALARIFYVAPPSAEFFFVAIGAACVFGGWYAPFKAIARLRTNA